MADDDRYELPKWLLFSWWLVYPGTALLVGRLLFEKTYMTWKQGPQMVGFSFVHLYPLLFLAGVASFYLAHAWLLAAGITAVPRRWKLVPRHWGIVTLTVATVMLDYVPTAAWQKVMMTFLGQGA